MTKTRIKGHEINTIVVRDTFNRRAIQFSNNIINTLKKIGLTDNDVDIKLEVSPMKKCLASASWYFEGKHLYYSYNRLNNFVENLYVVLKVIECEVNELLNNEKTAEEFILIFSEDKDVENKRKKARETLGLDHNILDMNVINTKYKLLAKECHPDMPNGNNEKFKTINHAHKILKRELE